MAGQAWDTGRANGSQADVTATVGVRVRAERARAGISRRRLAEIAEVSERYLNALENGEANVSVGVLARVAAALGVDLTSLLTAREGGSTAAAAMRALHPAFAGVVGGMSLREQEDAASVLADWLVDKRRTSRGIALLGLRGAGKTTIGGLFAERHNLPFISVTREVETRAGMPLNDLFTLGGSDAYRALENDVVKELSARDDRIVLETAGGLVSNAPALDLILAAFKTVWLKAAPEDHLQRVVNQGDMRPMRQTPKALEHLKTLLAVREQEYARADLVLETSGRTPEACADELERIAPALLAR